MSLFVSTVSSDVVVSELGITLTHPTVNFQVDAQFTGPQIRNAQTLTNAIFNGQLTWKKTSGGANELAQSYDPEHILLEQEQVGGQSSFGSYLYRATNAVESSTNSTTVFTTHTTLTTPSLPLGDYILIFSYKWRVANDNRGIDLNVVRNTVTEFSTATFTAKATATPTETQYVELLNISGVQTIDMQFNVSSAGATTAFLSNVKMTLWRIR